MMINEIKKVAKIVDEVLTFFMFNYNSEAAIDVRCKDNVFYLKFRFSPLDIGKKELEQLEQKFTASRQPELESYYWQLAGETEADNEISLVAMICDTGKIQLEDKTLKIELTRKVKK